jgi:hypothetical protein
MESEYFYKVQVLQADGWHDVLETEYNELFRAIHRAQSIAEQTNQQTRVVKPNGAVVWSQDLE